MGVHGLVWALTLAGVVGILLVDLLIIGRRPHEPKLRESLTWVGIYVALAILFGAGIWVFAGGGFAQQFYAGWITEYSLSVDNLFVFVIIMTRFSVPRRLQQKTLLIGIVMALLMRGAFIAAGAALINQFDWVFFIFGGFLIYTAIKLARNGEDDEGDFKENILIRLSKRWLRTTPQYGENGGFTTVVSGHKLLTPLLVVTIAIGTTDLVFALDSIPAIFGLTTEAFIVFTANVFALMGLRQLYFLLGDLLHRLKFLSIGLSIVLGFIGVKLVIEALHGNNLPFINGGKPVSWAPEVPIWVSLVVIAGTLVITTVASLWSSRRDELAAGVLEAAAASSVAKTPGWEFEPAHLAETENEAPLVLTATKAAAMGKTDVETSVSTNPQRRVRSSGGQRRNIKVGRATAGGAATSLARAADSSGRSSRGKRR